jgi:signal transduction histidine kinase/ligand-binding sensor domain-containing protein
LIKKFDFDKLPVKVYDSSGFMPFAHKPDSVKFDYDKLPDTVFDYNKLPSMPLKFETAILEQPQIIQSGPPRLIKGNKNIIYELGEAQGLVGNFINSIFEDKTGFLWVATDKGLYRYDGSNLLLYTNINGDYLISDMKEDTLGQIWMARIYNQGGQKISMDVIDPKNGIIKHLADSNGFGEVGTVNMLVDDKWRIWMTANSGVFIIDENSGTIKKFTRAQGLSGKSPNAIIQDNKNNIWISTFINGVNILDIKNGKIKYLNKSRGLSVDSVFVMKEDDRNKVWLSDRYGKLNSIDEKIGTIMNYSHVFAKNGPFDVVIDLLNDNRGNIWIGGYTGQGKPVNGAVIINPAKESIKTITTSDGLSANQIQRILQDKRGQIWIATAAGLNLIKGNGNDVQHIGKSDIGTLLEDSKGKIWIGNATEGIDILDTVTGLSRSFTTAQGLSNNVMQDMIEDNGKTFITTNGGIDIIDSIRTSIEHIGKDQGLNTDTIIGIIKDKQGLFWVVGYSRFGLDILDLKNNTIHHIGIAQGLNIKSIYNITQDRLGRIWFTYPLGGGITDTKSNTVKYVNNLPGLTVSNSFSKPLLQDKQGNMWVGTTQGIIIINEKTDSFISFSTRECLLDNNIFSLNKYDDQIYISTGGGINILTPPNAEQKNWKIESYGESQGITKLANTYNSDLITKNGKFFWGDRGITILNKLNKDTLIPKTYVSGFDIFNRPQYFSNSPWSYMEKEDTLWSSSMDSFYLNGNLPSSNSGVHQTMIKWDSLIGPYNMPVNLRLNYDNNYLQFYFSQGNSGGVTDTTWYSYILEGLDKNWSNKTANSHSENYLNLPIGNYIFRVCSKGSNGLWGKPAELPFTILPPWWKTWWAYTLYTLLFITVIWRFVRYRSRKLLSENRILEEKVFTRTHELQEKNEKVESTLKELKSTQAQLIQSEKMASLGELTAGIAHEIQNPLNFVNNFSDVNKELLVEMKEEMNKGNIDDANDIANDVIANEEKINHHGKRTDSIVKGMLQHSKKTSGQKEPTNIYALADEYLRLSFHGMRAKDKDFSATSNTDFDESIGLINIIPQDISRVLLNLYNNGFYAVIEKAKQQANGYDPTISVRTKKINNTVELTVKDNGNGIAQNIVDKIFQPFFTTKPTGEGTGLGLSLSYDIIKAHGGEITVESKEGESSEFKIQLPAYA